MCEYRKELRVYLFLEDLPVATMSSKDVSLLVLLLVCL